MEKTLELTSFVYRGVTPDFRVCRVVQPNAFDKVLAEHRSDSKSFHLRSDVSMLLYDKLVMKADELALEQFLKRASSSRPSTPPMSDEDLFKCVKSRYIQSHQDIAQYCKNIESEVDEVIRQYELEQASQPQADQVQNTVASPAASGSTSVDG